ncbi:MAG: protein kinase, partial [Chitinivibrionia bacterium]|nr:protein kinase [Chitinivibrionia bacterium]
MIGRSVSHYKILEKLGEGGMGVVYKAEDLSLQRTVALKFLPQESVASDSDRSRLIHEARAAAALLHPNICPVYEIGVSEGRMFIAMGCLEGRSLKERLSEGPLGVDEALRTAKEIGEALSAAHGKGIVHRDLKPGNVMVTPEERAVLMDFGLAKMTGSTKLTRTGAMVGTAAYMSPEQIRGEEVDERSDIWALGVVLYEMVGGESPFQGEYEPALFYAIVHGEPKLIASERIPAGLDGVIAKALAKNASERYQTAREFIKDIDTLMSDREALPAGRLRPAKDLRRAWSRWRPWQRAAAVSAACIVVAVLVSGVIALVKMRSARNASNLKNAVIAVIEFRNSVNPDDPTVSSGITQLVQVGLTETSPIRVISPELLYDIRRRLFGSQRGAIETDQVLDVAKTAGSTFFLTGEMMGTAGEEYVTWRLVETKSGKSIGGRRVMGETMMELADGIVHAVLPLLPRPAEGKVPETLSSVREIVTSSKAAYEHYVKAELAVSDVEKVAAGGRNEAIVELRRAIAIDSTFALAYLQLASVSFDLADTQDLKNLTEKAWAYRDRLGLRERMILEGYREELDGNVPAAMTTYREIHARWPDNKKALEWLTGTAFWYWYLEEAVTLGAQGLALYPDDALFRSCNLSALRELGRGEEALQAWIATAREHPTHWVWYELGENYWAQGIPDSAEACFRRSSFASPGESERKIADCFYARGDVNHAIQMREALMKQPDVNNEHKQTLLNGYANGLIYYLAEIGRFNTSIELLHEYGGVISGSSIIGTNAEIP